MKRKMFLNSESDLDKKKNSRMIAKRTISGKYKNDCN